MPQLSIETYMTQYLWLVIFLGFFYYYVATYIVPKISEIKKTRAKLSGETPALTAAVSSNQNIQLGLLYNIKKGGANKIGESFENMNKEWIKK